MKIKPIHYVAQFPLKVGDKLATSSQKSGEYTIVKVSKRPDNSNTWNCTYTYISIFDNTMKTDTASNLGFYNLWIVERKVSSYKQIFIEKLLQCS